MDCDNCVWKGGKEACRQCRQLAELEEQGIERQPWDIGHDIPQARERAEAQPWVKDISRKLESSNGIKTWAFNTADEALLGFMCLVGEEHVHYVVHTVDSVEYTEPQYGYQN